MLLNKIKNPVLCFIKNWIFTCLLAGSILNLLQMYLTRRFIDLETLDIFIANICFIQLSHIGKVVFVWFPIKKDNILVIV